MGSFQKVALTLGALLCITIVAMLTIQNWTTAVDISVGSLSLPHVSVGSVILIASLLGSVAVFIKLWDVNQQLRSEMKRFELRKEKAEVTAETSSDQIRSLESKIKTLEKALEQALSASSSKKGR